MSAISAYPGYLYGPIGQRIYPSPLDSPGKYRPRQYIAREVKRSISQFDHSELLSLSTQICSRIPALRAAIRDKNSWAFANWIPIYHGDNEKWGEQVEEWLQHEVFPNASFHEIRPDFTWGMRTSGMGMDIHADDLAIFTEDEYHNPKIMFIPAPRIGNGTSGSSGFMANVMSLSAGITMRPDGQSIVNEGVWKGYPIYNGIIRVKGRPTVVRILGTDDKGEPTYSDLRIGFNFGTHYGCEPEWFGQGRPVPRIASSILYWMKKEEIDDLLMKGLALAAAKTVIHQLPPGQDALMARGNAIDTGSVPVNQIDASGNIAYDQNGNPITTDREVFVEYTPDGNVMYIGSDENLTGLDYRNPSSDVEAFALRVLMETLADVGWCHRMLDSTGASGAPTRLDVQKANNSISDRQTIEEIRTIQFVRYAVAKGIKEKQIPANDAGAGMDAMRWGVGFPAQITVDQGNDVTASLNRLKMGLTNERIESAKDGHREKYILRQRRKEMRAKQLAALDDMEFLKGKGVTVTFQQAMEFYYQPNPNSSATQLPNAPETENAPEPPPQPQPNKK